MSQEEKQKLKQEFFNRLREELERIYPKGEKKEEMKESPRSRALVFNASANIIFRDIIDKL